ncbi:MAG TPA: flagellar biosynthesis anti-sigma factor FlgM [Anaerolineaceae bacterium]
MKIENNYLNPLSPKKSDGVTPVEKNPRSVEQSSGVTGKDKAEFSGQARLLSKARMSLDEAADIRAEVVNNVRGMVENGTYRIPVEDLAKKLLSLIQGK